MALVIACLVFVIFAVLSYFLINVHAVSSQSLEMRFKIIGDIIQQRTEIEERELSKSFFERIIIPLGKKTAGKFKSFTPAGVTEMMEKRLLLAGGMAGLSADQFVAVTGIMAGLAAIVCIIVSFLLGSGLAKIITAGCYGLVLGLAFPYFMLSRKIAVRQASIQKNLPDVLDLMTVSVEAGLSFDGALAKLSEKMKGTLVDEFSRALQEMRMGVTRRDALKAMSARCDNKDLSLFVTALVQADQLGVSIGSILRVQAAGIRQNRKQQIEQQAAKAPIKMLFPMVVCIFPSLFIVALGPGLLRVFTQLFK